VGPDEDVFTRMAKDAQEKPIRVNQLRKQMLKAVDSQTGQPLFKPLLNVKEDEGKSKARKSHVKQDGGIGNYLYK
jgi:hypothetical protein